MLPGHSHVPGVVLQFEDGRGEAEPLVAVSSQYVPLRHNVVRGGTHQLVAISTPAAHTQMCNISFINKKKKEMLLGLVFYILAPKLVNTVKLLQSGHSFN